MLLDSMHRSYQLTLPYASEQHAFQVSIDHHSLSIGTDILRVLDKDQFLVLEVEVSTGHSLDLRVNSSVEMSLVPSACHRLELGTAVVGGAGLGNWRCLISHVSSLGSVLHVATSSTSANSCHPWTGHWV